MCRNGTHQQATVGSAANGKPLFTRVALVDEKLSCGDKVVEYILLLQFGAGNVPAFPYSPPPRMLGTAYMPPISSQAATVLLKRGRMLILKPP